MQIHTNLPPLHEERHAVEAGNFQKAGEVSSLIKRRLKRLGVQSGVIRRVAVASYEVELNLIIHSLGGEIWMALTPEEIVLRSQDVGPGIADVETAMREGYSTASDDVRMMGFGAGMGLPNMKRNASDFDIQSTLGEGTVITMRFLMETNET